MSRLFCKKFKTHFFIVGRFRIFIEKSRKVVSFYPAIYAWTSLEAVTLKWWYETSLLENCFNLLKKCR